MKPETRPLARVVVILLAVQLASWLVFFLYPQSKRFGVDVLSFIPFLSIAFAIFMIVKYVQWKLPVWYVIGMLVVGASSMIQVFANLYWDIGTKAHFSIELTRFDAMYFSVGTLGGGTGGIVATDEVSRSIQTFQTFFNLAFTLFAVGLVVTRMADSIGPDLALRGSGQPDQAEQLNHLALTVSEQQAAIFGLLADQALDLGETDQAEQLHLKALALRQKLATLAPDNLAYVRDVSASYERLGTLRESTGDVSDAAQWFTRALDVRRILHSRDPARTDLAEELGISLKLCAQVLADDSELRNEAYQVLAPHGQRNQLSAEGADVLTWAQEAPAN